DVLAVSLKSGNTESCGCQQRDIVAARNTKHGLRGAPEYAVWQGMNARCYNENFEQYEDYGGRGITVCERWRRSFLAFYTDMGRRPSARHTIERKDNKGS